MKTKIKALTSFMHGRVHAHQGDEVEVSKGEADDLINAGLAEKLGADGAAPEVLDTQVVAAQKDPTLQLRNDQDEGVDDLLGGEGQKMDDAPQNKMEDAPDNKAGGKPKTHAKK